MKGDGFMPDKVVLDAEETGRRIRQVCEQRGVTPRMISQELGLSIVTPYKWFNGRNLPSIDHFVELCKLLDVEMQDLIVTKTL